MNRRNIATITIVVSFFSLVPPICLQNYPWVSADNKATYTVIAPAKLRPNSDYHVSVSVHHIQEHVDVDVSISGSDLSTGNYNSLSKTIKLDPGETRIMNFQIGEWGPGNYTLTVVGRGGLLFRNESKISFEQKSYSVFIQTDKAIYKPGQTVKFRAIIVNPSLLPTVTGAVRAYVTDSKGNRVKQWDRIFSTKGVISQEFLLSNNTLLGDWTIFIDVLGQLFQKSFTVAEYVLPTFDVDVLLPAYALYEKPEIVVKVKSAYTYGKPVKGDLTLTVQPRVRYNTVSVRPLEQFQYTSPIDGTVDIPVNLVRDLNLKTDLFEREIEFFALVKEALTGKTYNKTGVLRVYKNDVKLELVKTSKTFKPGLKYTILIKVSYQDDKPVEDDGPPLTLRYGYFYNEENHTNVAEIVPRRGFVKHDIFPPQDKDIFVLGMHALYKGKVHHLENVEAAQSPSNNFIQVTMPENQEAVVNRELLLDVNATEALHGLVYEVMGRGDIVLARSSYVPNSKTHKIYFTVTHNMAPKARVVVYYVRRENQEVVADAVNFDVEGIFRTPVSVETSVSETKPKSAVDVRVSTKPHAFVAVLGLDQSILLLKSGNDITQQDVIEELETYDGGKTESVPVWYGRKKRSTWWPGSTSAGEIFDDSGVVILSNGLIHHNFAYIYYRMSPMLYDDGGFGSSFLKSAPGSRPGSARASTNRLENLRHSNTVRVRKHFPETWLWTTTESGRNGSAVISSVVPDTITSWIITAFAVDSLSGLGISATPAKLTVFRPFFVKMNLPHSVIRQETVAIQVIVFNYFNKPIEAEVALYNNGDFNFTLPSNEVDSLSSDSMRKKYITIPPQDGASAVFLITTNKIGLIALEARATTERAGDAEKRHLLVKSEGQPQYFNKAFMADLRAPGLPAIKENISIVIPSNAVAGSEQVTVSVIGDVLGSSLNNLEDLLRMPYGCGEQNMLNFVPNIVILDYLSRAHKLTDAVRAKSIRNMEIGYQRQLGYKRHDNSFSAFGNSDKMGSTWLTAFVLKSFQQARGYIDIDDTVIDDCTRWLMARHLTEGNFDEPGEIHYKPMQGGSNSASPTLTAYVLIAIFQNKTFVRPKYNSQILRAEQYLVRELRRQKSAYAVAIITYALHLIDSPAQNSAYDQLLGLAQRGSDYLWWGDVKHAADRKGKQSAHFFLPESTDIEATAYALLTLVTRGEINRAIPVMRWLISQQNSNGGFSSTQDTVIGLQALGQLAGAISTKTVSMTAKFNFGNVERSREFRITDGNTLVLQKFEVPRTSKVPHFVEVEVAGFGTAVVQVSWSYNLAVSAEEPSFFLNPLLSGRSTENFLQLNICTYYKAGNETNMAVMDVELPSGYTADVDAIQSIRSQAKGVKRIESLKEDTNVVIYFDRVTRNELCLTVPAHRNFKVAHSKPVPVTLYDYYDRARTARLFYEPVQSTSCDICDKSDCVSCNKLTNELTNQDLTDQGGSGANKLDKSVTLVVLFCLAFILRL